MIPQSEIDQVKQAVRIPEFLLVHGFRPAYQHGKEFVYYSPFREEKTPSFFVNIERNVFKDFGETEDRGDVIRLCMKLRGLTFGQALKYLCNWKGSPSEATFSFSGLSSPQKEPTNGVVIKSFGKIRHPALKAYVSKRGISFDTASRYLSEVHYERKERALFGVGMQNDLGGWAIRNDTDFPQATKPNYYTTIPVDGSTTINLFEGMFDFLSALDYWQLREPSRTTIILNSVSHLGKALDTLRKAKKVYCFLDNDRAGENAIDRMEREGIATLNQATIYHEYKDFNDFLRKKIYQHG